MIKPIIFLDLDGVLNHENYYVAQSKRSMSELWYEHYFCPISVSHLNRITDKTNARIVFSSSHRFKFDTLEELQHNMKLAGVTGAIIDITPKLRYTDDSHSVPRGCEIKAWMERNKDILGDKISKLKYVILDDDTDMLYWQRHSFFCCKGKGGLTEKITNKVIAYLKSF